jgi:hypothetical protein
MNWRSVEGLRPVAISFTDTSLVVALADGRSIATPLAWYPRLARDSDAERRNHELGPLGLHWPAPDEDLSVAGMLRRQSAG